MSHGFTDITQLDWPEENLPVREGPKAPALRPTQTKPVRALRRQIHHAPDAIDRRATNRHREGLPAIHGYRR